MIQKQEKACQISKENVVYLMHHFVRTLLLLISLKELTLFGFRPTEFATDK